MKDKLKEIRDNWSRDKYGILDCLPITQKEIEEIQRITWNAALESLANNCLTSNDETILKIDLETIINEHKL